MADAREARIARIVDHAPDVRSLFLTRPAGAPFAFRPGQFLSCLLPVDDETLTRPYSIASSPEEPELELCLDRVPGGRGSHHLFARSIGDPIRFTGPWGTFALDRAPDAPTVFIADGTGIAPIRPMLRRALATTSRHPLTLLQAVSDVSPRLWGAELDALARGHAGLTVETTASATLRAEVERRWVHGAEDRSSHFFICGVGAIVPALRDLLRGAGYARRAVQYERW